MKRATCTFTFILMLLLGSFSTSLASFSLDVREPSNRWTTLSQANIDEATVTLKPTGAYVEVGLYLTFSATGSAYDNSWNPLEIVMDFELPEGAIVHDSWLWVDQDIIQGIVLGRATATGIYEDIVGPPDEPTWTDPSVLTKNGNQYQLRVYPMNARGGNWMETRKVKITYLVPAVWNEDEILAPLPTQILRTSRVVPQLNVIAYNDSEFSTPKLYGAAGTPLIPGTANNEHFGQISSSVVGAYVPEVRYRKTYKDVFLSIYPQTQNSGYYHLMCDPNNIPTPTPLPRKVVALLEHYDGNSFTTRQQILDMLENFLLTNYNNTDSLLLFYYQNQTIRHTPTWISIDAANLQTLVNQMASGWNTTNGFDTKNLILTASDFLTTRSSTATMFLFTNNKLSSSTASNHSLMGIASQMSTRVPVNIVNYCDNKINSQYWADRVFSNLALQTGGYYTRLNASYLNILVGANTNPPIANSLLGLVNNLTLHLFSGLQNVDLTLSTANGYSFDRVTSTTWSTSNGQTVYFQTGRYVGSGSFDVELNALRNGQVLTTQWNIAVPYYGDTLTRKIWADNYIKSIDRGSVGNTSALFHQIIDSSKVHRVLTDYTAFLCLEPNDTILPCEGCEDETENFPDDNLISVEDISNADLLAISVAPNPFSNIVTLTIDLSALNDGDIAELTIVDILGRKVKTIDLSAFAGTEAQVTWDGTDEFGEELQQGVYIVMVNTPKGKLTTKIVKQ